MSVATPLPIGSHLVCPTCGTLRINHDCVAEIENPKPKKPKPTLQELLWGDNKPKAKKKKKENPWDGVPCVFFAWRGHIGKIGKQRGYKDERAVRWGNKDADYISVGKFKKGGAGKHRTLEHLVSIDKCYSDIDSDLPLTWEEIITRCNEFNISIPGVIVETSPNHYQPVWRIPEIDKSLLGLWEKVQEGIFNLFKAFGADPQALDAIRYLRNPGRCKKVYENKVARTSLTVLYRSLKMAGFIETDKPKWRTKFSPNGIPIKESRAKLIKFFTDSPEYESSYGELSYTLSIPVRTVKYLIRQFKGENRLETQVLGKGKHRKTRFIFKVHIKNLLNTLPLNRVGGCGDPGVFSPFLSLGKEKKESVFVFSQALGQAKAVGFSRGLRNFGFFGLALWLRVSKKMSYDDIHKELFPVLIFTLGFSRREFEKTLKSVCRDKYRYCMSAKKFERVFVSLGLGGVH